MQIFSLCKKSFHFCFFAKCEFFIAAFFQASFFFFCLIFATTEAHQISTAESQSSMSLNKKLIAKSPTCFYDPSTCRRQSFSVPEKIVYYIAKNPSNADTFNKLVQTCKYFYKVNPVIVVPQILCYQPEWIACYGEDCENRVEFKHDQPKSFKIWITQKVVCFFGKAPHFISSIYKNDAKVVNLRHRSLKLEDFLFYAGNAEELSMWHQVVKYANGEIVQFEDVVKNLPKLKSLNFAPYFNLDVNCNTVKKLMELEHFKNISRLKLEDISEALDIEEMVKYILENKQIEVDLCYYRDISDAAKERIQEYSNRLKNEAGCNSSITFDTMYGIVYGPYETAQTSSSEDDSSDTSFESSDDDNISDVDVDENEDLLFPWNTEDEEEWELPWDKE